jgi:hypothetical protein
VYVLLAGGIASGAAADTVSISGMGDGVTLNSGPMGTNVVGANQSVWSHVSLIAANAALHASGISTNGKVTILAANTSRGLSVMALFDDDVAGQVPISMGNVGMSTFATGTNMSYVNAGANNVTITPNGSASCSATGTVQWNSNGGGNGFAWTGLTATNTVSYHFSRVASQPMGLTSPSTFQFATWNGAGWELVPIANSFLSFDVNGNFGFSGQFTTTVIPLPAGGAMAGIGLLGLGLVRRRRVA